MLRRVLIANRGEIAIRIIRACFDEGIESVVPVAPPDADGLVARMADRHVVIEGRSATDTYLSVAQIVSAALITRCDAVHPGYGFLSERPELARACARHGLVFVGPTADTIERGGDKLAARELATSLGIPVGAGSAHLARAEDALAAANGAGYPVLLKAAAGGGGRGMAVVASSDAMAETFVRAGQEALNAFGDPRLFLEHYVGDARHVEVQILGDGRGNVIHLGDRDCSYQRRHQKLIEEAPAVAVPGPLRTALQDAAVELGIALDYAGAGTVEFLVDQDRGSFSFLEINTRLQVEHPVTELVTGIDIVREQLRIAGGAALSIRQADVRITGHAIECRINAEDPRHGFLPTPGPLTRWEPPQGGQVRVDTHCFPGYRVPPYYDSLLAKLIVHGADRRGAVTALRRALDRFAVEGIETTLDFHREVAAHPDFADNRVNTRWVEERFLPAWTSGPPLEGVA